MRYAPTVLLAVAALLCAPSRTARGADAARYDILSLRLAMPATEVLEQLRAQGITQAAVQLGPPGCIAAQADLCARTISARTRDGQLQIQLTRAPAGQPRLHIAPAPGAAG